MSAAEARLLRAVARSLETFDTDIGTVENAVGKLTTDLKEHEVHDVNRFLQLHQGMADLHHEFEFVKNFMTILQDSMIDGFRKLGAEVEKKDPNEVTPPRRGRNGQ